METLKLIPWCATGLLTDDERAYINEQLKQHPALQEYIEEELELIKLLSEDKSLLDLSILEPTESRLEKVMESLDQSPNETLSAEKPAEEESPDTSSLNSSLNDVNTANTNGLFSWLTKFFPGMAGGNNKLYYARFASIAVVLGLLVAFIAPLIIKDKMQNTFHPASVQNTESTGQSTKTSLLLGINGDLRNPWLLDFLKKNNAKISKIPGKDGLYRIQFEQKMPANKIESLTRQLKDHKELIWFVGEAY